jgi:predicted MFS family arabinose efflux permease
MSTIRGGTKQARGSAWTPFRHRVFRALWIAQFVSNVGTWMQTVGAVWVMLELKGSPTFVALVATASSLPTVFLGVIGGALADLLDRRRLLLVTQTLMLAAAAALAVLDASGRLTPSSLLGLTFALGVGAALNGPAWQAIQPELVPREEFPQAVTLGGASINLGRALGPALGGFILAVAQAWLVFALNALSFGVVVIVLWVWKRAADEGEGPPERFAGAVRAGLRYAFFSRTLTGVLVRAGLFSVASAGLMALLPVYSKNVLALGSSGLGLLLAGFGGGALIAAALLPRVRGRVSQDGVVAIGTVMVAAALLALAIVRWAPLALAVMVCAGAGWLLCLSTFNVASQEALPGWVRARGLAMYLTAFTGGIALGSAAWGYLADSLGTPTTFAWGALAVALTPLLGLRWHLSPVGDLDLSPAPMYAPEMRLAVEDAGGPVFVTVVYEVRSGAVDEFQRAVRRVGRARRRTGAVRWSIYRDAEAPQRFVEMFIVPSWQEHVRQHERRTVTDAGLQESLRVFLVEGDEPQVAHFVAPPRPARRRNG